jgi:hypothetical protein
MNVERARSSGVISSDLRRGLGLLDPWHARARQVRLSDFRHIEGELMETH